jgi:hypothetical protein
VSVPPETVAAPAVGSEDGKRQYRGRVTLLALFLLVAALAAPADGTAA